jgi:glycerol-3-phosphate dehydrogenase (NAD(P)+)
MTAIDHIGVIGAGSWGTALAATAARAGHRVTMWARSEDLCRRINETRQNADYLPGVDLPDTIRVTTATQDLATCNAILIVTPAQAMRTVMTGFAPHLAAGIPAAICCKGIETATGMFMSDVLGEACPALTPAVLSGPSFAADVVKGLPTAVTLAAADLATAKKFARALTITSFRIYAGTDVEGVELCGAAKNVMAIACGIAGGKNLGESAKAALITRGFAELSRLAKPMNVQPATLTGLSGLGDLILTCSSTQSRNFSLGFALGQGQTIEQHMAGRKTVAEGVPTAGVLVDLAHKNDVEMPISEAVAAIVSGRSTADEEIARLLARPVKSE